MSNPPVFEIVVPREHGDLSQSDITFVYPDGEEAYSVDLSDTVTTIGYGDEKGGYFIDVDGDFNE